jgi:hypothetical protein
VDIEAPGAMKRPLADFGRRLREARLDRRGSLADLAVRVGLSKGRLSGIETGLAWGRRGTASSGNWPARSTRMKPTS